MTDSRLLGIVFSNMHDDTIRELTANRTMGSVPYGGRYRLVDFALSSLVNSGVSTVGIITKSNYQSLMDHVGSGRDWDLSRKIGGLSILPPFGNSLSNGIYSGDLEALDGVMNYIRRAPGSHVLLCDCDLVANIDYRAMMEAHLSRGADVTMLYSRSDMPPARHIQPLVALNVGEEGRVQDILIARTMDGEMDLYLNTLIIKKDLLDYLVKNAMSRDQTSLVRDVLQKKAQSLRIYGYQFEGYYRRIESMNSFFEGNMELLDAEVRRQLFPRNRPVYTKVRDEFPSRYAEGARVENSLLADGCLIEGEVTNSILFRGVHVEKGARVDHCILMQACRVGAGSQLDYVITDKDVSISSYQVLHGAAHYPMFLEKGSRI